MITARDVRALQRGLLVIGAGWLLMHAPALLDRVTTGITALHTRRALIARTQADNAQRAHYVQLLTQLRQRVDSTVRDILPDSVATEAGQSLRDSVQVILESHEVRIAEVSELSDVSDGTQNAVIARASVRCVFESDLDEIVDTLRELDGEGVMSLTSLRISAPERTEPEPATEILRVEATVTAWYRIGPRRTPPGRST